MLSKRVVASLDFCSPFKFVVVSRPQPRSSIFPGARDERKQGAVRPVQRVRGFLNGQYTSLGTSCSPAPGGNQWKRALLVDSPFLDPLFSIKGVTFSQRSKCSGISNVSASDKDTPSAIVFGTATEKKKKKEEWIRHRYLLASFLLRNETVEGRINFVRSVISFEIPFEILFHARFFFCNFVFKPSATEHFLRRPMIAMVIDREYCGGKERRKKKMHASVGRLHNCFTKHEFIVQQKEEA